MIKVEKPQLADATWVAAVQKGAQLAKAHLDDFKARKDFKIDDVLYKRFMSFLLDLFKGKCAYCEVLLTNNQPGDVEHFRPKGRVVDDALKPVRVHYETLGEIDHPGYFWLAYDWDNLLPSCIDCNRYRKHDLPEGVVGAGKADRFPVVGKRASLPGEELDEQALLVNPSKVDPADHFVFGADGLIVARTPVGERTLKELGLNVRERMVEVRRNAYEDAVNLMGAFLDAAKAGNVERADRLRERINSAWDGLEAHTVMQRMALRAVQAHWANFFTTIPLPIPPLPGTVSPPP